MSASVQISCLCTGSFPTSFFLSLKVKLKVKVVDLYSASTRRVSKALRYSTHCQGITQFYLHTLRFIRKRNELYLPLPFQPQLVLIYWPRRDGRLSRPWCEVPPAEIRTCNLPIANPALYHTATSAQFFSLSFLHSFHVQCLMRKSRKPLSEPPSSEWDKKNSRAMN